MSDPADKKPDPHKWIRRYLKPMAAGWAAVLLVLVYAVYGAVHGPFYWPGVARYAVILSLAGPAALRVAVGMLAIFAGLTSALVLMLTHRQVNNVLGVVLLCLLVGGILCVALAPLYDGATIVRQLAAPLPTPP